MFKDKLKELRRKNGLSQEALGEMVGLRKAAISKYETGKVVNPKPALIEALAKALGTTETYLMSWDSDLAYESSMFVRTGLKIKEAARKYTYADYAGWGDEKRYEIIDGRVYLMSPAPSVAHQTISGRLFTRLFIFLDGKPCRVYNAPFDVCLNAKGDDDDTIVQPDILIICDKSKLDAKRCNGAPDMVIEILSETSARRDAVIKLRKYQGAGVREYWIVDPFNKSVIVNILKNTKYKAKKYKENDVVPVNILDGCEISLESVFAL
jgi:Uma2 family endonuclease/DNA-binding XRE family transcriptional regulator